MDPLALLCNLHADGPATLDRLRRAGCESLGRLIEWESAELVSRLEWEQRRAERFLREAGLLLERIDGVCLEPDSDQDRDADEDAEPSVEAAAEPTPGAAASANPTSVESVARAWRELDREHPPEEPTEYILPAHPPSASGIDRPLAAGLLEGLDASRIEALAGLGVRTLGELAQAATVPTSEALGLGYSRVARLQFLARRALDEAPRPVPARSSEPAQPSAPRPPSRSESPPESGPGASGPFA